MTLVQKLGSKCAQQLERAGTGCCMIEERAGTGIGCCTRKEKEDVIALDNRNRNRLLHAPGEENGQVDNCMRREMGKGCVPFG